MTSTVHSSQRYCFKLIADSRQEHNPGHSELLSIFSAAAGYRGFSVCFAFFPPLSYETSDSGVQFGSTQAEITASFLGYRISNNTKPWLSTCSINNQNFLPQLSLKYTTSCFSLLLAANPFCQQGFICNKPACDMLGPNTSLNKSPVFTEQKGCKKDHRDRDSLL